MLRTHTNKIIIPNCRKASEFPLSFNTECNAFRNAKTTTTAKATAGSPVVFERKTPT